MGPCLKSKGAAYAQAKTPQSQRQQPRKELLGPGNY